MKIRVRGREATEDVHPRYFLTRDAVDPNTEISFATILYNNILCYVRLVNTIAKFIYIRTTIITRDNLLGNLYTKLIM